MYWRKTAMIHNTPVRCLVNRSWNIATREWDGETINGTLVDISTQTADDNSGDLIPVGIVITETGAFQSVPVEFITKI